MFLCDSFLPSFACGDSPSRASRNQLMTGLIKKTKRVSNVIGSLRSAMIYTSRVSYRRCALTAVSADRATL
eukprot:2993753-Prymnesium_polylepis.2